MLRGQERRDLLAVLLDQVPDPEHDLGPLRQRRRAPGRERGARRRDGGVDLLDRGEVHLAGDLAGRRVVDRARAPGRARDAAPADPVADRLGERRARLRLSVRRAGSWWRSLGLAVVCARPRYRDRLRAIRPRRASMSTRRSTGASSGARARSSRPEGGDGQHADVEQLLRARAARARRDRAT